MLRKGRVHAKWMHVSGLHWSMSKLNFVSSLLVDVYVFLWLRPDWTCFPCKIITADSCKWLHNLFSLNYSYFASQHFVVEDSHLLPCGCTDVPRYCRLRFPRLCGCTKWPFFAHKGTFSICSGLPLQRVVILELRHLTNTMTNTYLRKVMHFLSKTWPLCLQSVARLFV